MDNRSKGHAGQRRSMSKGPVVRSSKAVSGQEQKGPNEGSLVDVGDLLM